MLGYMSETSGDMIRAGHGIPHEWEEAGRAGQPTGDPWVDGIAAWTISEAVRMRRSSAEETLGTRDAGTDGFEDASCANGSEASGRDILKG